MHEPDPQPMIERFRRARRDPDLTVLEGLHPLKHAVRFGAELREVVAAEPERVRSLADTLAPDLTGRLDELTVVSDDVFERLAPRPPSTGVIALARRPAVPVSAVLDDAGGAPVVLLERPTHLGNIGAAVRVAAAAGAAGLVATGEHDPWHPAALRGGAGLQYALPVARADALPACDRPLVAIDPEGEALGPDTALSRAVLAFGSERSGLTDELLARADRRVRIPMRAGVSSLNLATAVAVVLYAWRLA